MKYPNFDDILKKLPKFNDKGEVIASTQTFLDFLEDMSYLDSRIHAARNKSSKTKYRGHLKALAANFETFMEKVVQ